MLGDQESVEAKPEEVFCLEVHQVGKNIISIQKHKKIEIYLTNFMEFIFFSSVYINYPICAS